MRVRRDHAKVPQEKAIKLYDNLKDEIKAFVKKNFKIQIKNE